MGLTLLNRSNSFFFQSIPWNVNDVLCTSLHLLVRLYIQRVAVFRTAFHEPMPNDGFLIAWTPFLGYIE